jgi:membrane-associated phospholipid phosphatase
MITPRRLIALNIVLFAVVVMLTRRVVTSGGFVGFDLWAMRMARHLSPSRDWLLVTDKLALRGMILTICIPFMVWLARRERTWTPVVGLLLVLAFETGMTGSLKVAVGRTFPYERHLRLGTDSLAFPSGHATNAAALWGYVLWYVTDARREWRRAAMAAWVSILVIAGVSSWLLRTHWPTDLLAGYAIGGIAVSAVVAMLVALDLNPAARFPHWHAVHREMQGVR